MSKNRGIREEMWKDIPNYEGLYQVSNLGQIRSLDRIVKDTTRDRFQKIKGKILKYCDNGKGYKLVYLNKNRKRKNYYVHRLVANVFLENPNNLPEINHLDLNKNNNRIDNLEWCTGIENKRHYQSTDIAKERNKIKGKRITEKNKKRINEQKDRIIELYNKGLTILQIARTIHTECTQITRILKNNLDNYEQIQRTKRSNLSKELCNKINSNTKRRFIRDKLGRFTGVIYE